MQECKGVCVRNKAILSGQTPKYAVGVYRCQTCNIFLTVNGVKFGERKTCLCCGQLIRSKPRHDEEKKKYYEELASRFA